MNMVRVMEFILDNNLMNDKDSGVKLSSRKEFKSLWFAVYGETLEFGFWN